MNSNKIIYDSNFGYIFTTDYTDFTDFSSQGRRWRDAEQSEWQEPPRLNNPYNPCNPLWKNTSFSTTNKANNSNLPCGEKMYFPNAASGDEWNRMATLSIRFYSLHPGCIVYCINSSYSKYSLWKNTSGPSARRSQFFMNLIICSFRRIHVKVRVRV